LSYIVYDGLHTSECKSYAPKPGGRDAKADRTKWNEGAEHYSGENWGAAVAPAYAAGHGSIYTWRCSAGRAVPDGAVAHIVPTVREICFLTILPPCRMAQPIHRCCSIGFKLSKKKRLYSECSENVSSKIFIH
jgi:hypothetical protein